MLTTGAVVINLKPSHWTKMLHDPLSYFGTPQPLKKPDSSALWYVGFASIVELGLALATIMLAVSVHAACVGCGGRINSLVMCCPTVHHYFTHTYTASLLCLPSPPHTLIPPNPPSMLQQPSLPLTHLLPPAFTGEGGHTHTKLLLNRIALWIVYSTASSLWQTFCV